ncbi:MAG: metallophosphoesterase [Patescibacteria group bacterium]|nr:metallophosphoesterase [Patescibacteria group bacterium]
MKLGIFSDTHDQLESVEKAIKFFQKEKVELIIHCGDWVSPFVPQFIYSLKPKLTIPIKSVFGNNDEGDHFRFFERKEKENWHIEFYKESFELEIGAKKIAVYHGSSKVLTDSLIKSQIYDVVFTGHTHQALIEKIGKTLHLNPGSTAGYAFGKITLQKTIALYETKTNQGKIIDL